MIEALFILASAILYRIRGHGTPLPGPISALVVWAAPTAFGAWWLWGTPTLDIGWDWFGSPFAATYNAHIIPVALALWLTAAETQLGKWADWGPHPGANVGWQPWPLIWRGALAGMPLYPYCYWITYRFRDHWPDAGPLLRARWWTAWGEVFCGVQTPIVFVLIGMVFA